MLPKLPYDTVRLALQLNFTAKMAASIGSSSKSSDDFVEGDDEDGEPSFQI